MVEDVTLFGFAKVETRYDEQQGDPVEFNDRP